MFKEQADSLRRGGNVCLLTGQLENQRGGVPAAAGESPNGLLQLFRIMTSSARQPFKRSPVNWLGTSITLTPPTISPSAPSSSCPAGPILLGCVSQDTIVCCFFVPLFRTRFTV